MGAQKVKGSMKLKKPLITNLRWVVQILLVALLLFMGLIAYMLIRESIARNKYRAVCPPPGKMVNINTHDIHLNCVGAGNPTVVFEADIDQFGSLSWDPVQSEVVKFARACCYDRAGIMWSEPGPRPRDGEMIASELSIVLDVTGEDGPFVLVGHAFGGAYVRIFAGQNPDAVCGMVLVDSSHPDQLTRFAEIGIEKEISEKQIRPLILLLSHLGMPGRFTGPQYSMPDEVYAAEQAFLPESSMAWFDESVEAPNTLAQAGQVEYLGGIPLIVLASARSTSIQVEGRDLQDTWLEMQQELTLLSQNSEIMVLEDSGHYIQYDRPDVVIEAIQKVVQQCQTTLVP
jgi:pimeloyl-ACP methyl ester carboxylesterase